MAFATIGTGLGNIVMAHVMSALVIEYQFFGTMLVVGALMLNNCVGACLYKKPRAPSKTKQAAIDESKKPNLGLIEKQLPSSGEQENLNGMVPEVGIWESGALVLANADTSDAIASKDDGCIRPKCLSSSLWCNFPFLIHCATMTGLQGCIQCVLLFLPSYAKELGSSFQQEAWLLTLFGIWDMIGRFAFGFIFDLKWVRTRRTHMYTFVSAGFAIFAILLALTSDFLGLAIVTCFTAFFEGGSHSQRATIIPDLVEKTQMSIGIGLGFFFMGIGNFYGPLVGGKI